LNGEHLFFAVVFVQQLMNEGISVNVNIVELKGRKEI